MSRNEDRKSNDQGRADKSAKWSEADLKNINRLVRKYGVDAVRRMADVTLPSRPGRPSRGILPLTERMHLAQWLEEAAEEHRNEGTREFAAAAIHDLFVLTIDEDEQRQPGRFVRFHQTTKRKWIQGRRELIQYLESCERHPSESTRAMARDELQRIKRREE